MPDKLFKTKGIVLRAVKYGETSLIVTIFTELFGIQSYLVNGVRKSTKKGSGKASLFQPAAILEMVVYHSELKNLQRIREFRWGYLYSHILVDVKKNAVALFLVELLTKCLKQPEANPDLFQFSEDIFIHLDRSTENTAANFPLFFALHLTVFLGLRMSDNYSDTRTILDLQEGVFVDEKPHHPYYIEDKEARVTSDILKVMQPEELADTRLNHEFRKSLLFAYERYYSLHIHDFGTLRSLPVLSELFS
jgi:DNA repair protein RecO (recombination protein O)